MKILHICYGKKGTVVHFEKVYVKEGNGMRLRWILIYLLIIGMVVYNFTVSIAEETTKRDALMEFIDKFSQSHGRNLSVDKDEDNNWRLYYFFSFSMPGSSIKRMVEQAKNTDMTLVIMGMKENSMKETVIAIQKLEQSMVYINPLLFRKFGIKKVPALVLGKGKCDNNRCAVIREEDFFIIYGDVTLDYAINQMIKKEPALETQLNPILFKLNGGFFRK